MSDFPDEVSEVSSTNSSENYQSTVVADFPDVIEVFSTDSSQNYRSKVVTSFGRYVKTEDETSNGKPVWRHESNDRVFHKDGGNWCFGTPISILNKLCGFIRSSKVNKDIANSGHWQYYNEGSIWQDDFTITVKGWCRLIFFCCTFYSIRLCFSHCWKKGSIC